MEQDYFHGLLPRDDVAVLLTKHGDFLVRLSEADTMGARLETVLSVMHDPRSRCKTRDPEARMDFVRVFHLIHQLSFGSRLQQVQLLRGVGLASWEFRAEHVQLDQLICRFSCGEVRRGKIVRKDSPKLEVAVKT
ncbi:hypothetical protein OSTOST_20806, partial [Ostertagia ostertagi]